MREEGAERAGDKAGDTGDTGDIGEGEAGSGGGVVGRGAQGHVGAGGDRVTAPPLSPQAKYLAQIILVGAQVVGRAFMRALRQEFAGRSPAPPHHPPRAPPNPG